MNQFIAGVGITGLVLLYLPAALQIVYFVTVLGLFLVPFIKKVTNK